MKVLKNGNGVFLCILNITKETFRFEFIEIFDYLYVVWKS